MSKIRITKHFEFEMAHSLLNYDGLCKFIHGHTYKLEVTLIGTAIDDSSNPKHGMLIDFKDLKTIVNKNVVNIFDHAYVINSQTPQEEVKFIRKFSERTLVVDYQPTCEQLTLDFVDRLKNNFPNNIVLHSLRLYETTTSFTEWFASDNI